jgi:phage replication-related protein YjqB (UPF0714/DUF867 family)
MRLIESDEAMSSYHAWLLSSTDVPNGNIREHCIAHQTQITSIGRNVGKQVRVERYTPDGATLLGYALYTVIAVHDQKPDAVFVGYENLSDLNERLDASGAEPFTGKIDSRVIDGTEFSKHLRDNGRHRGLVVMAPHGGDIELKTAEQAKCVGERLASKCLSVWTCKGEKPGGGPFDRWHITSIDISEGSFSELNTIIDRGFEFTLAFHGWTYDSICISGSARAALKQEIKTAVQSLVPGIVVCTDDDRCCSADFNRDHPRNMVNRLAANGIQLEQSKIAREDHGLDIAHAVAEVMHPLIIVCTGPVFRASQPWQCFREGMVELFGAVSDGDAGARQCAKKRLRFRIRHCRGGNTNPCHEL